MKFLVLGSGLMGPAAAYIGMQADDVSAVTLADRSAEQLATAQKRLTGLPGLEKVAFAQIDLADRDPAIALFARHDVVLAALPSEIIPLGMRTAIAARRPLVDLSTPPAGEMAALEAEAAQAGAFLLRGCGVEPGLTEIWARHLAEELESIDSLHIKCGGIPAAPTPPLGYKIVFGGRRLPLRAIDGHAVEAGALVQVARYSDAEPVTFDGVGEVEAWHENFMPWLLELESLKGLGEGSQKTIRWPGYAAKVTLLKELGLLSSQPIDIDGASIAPKHFLDVLLYPKVRFDETDRDITLVRLDAEGTKDGKATRLSVEMIDRYDEALGFTSMARTTAMTGAIIARMVGRGEISGRGLLTPEKVVTGPHFERLMGELAAIGVIFTQSVHTPA
ncbi:MAG: saccharopine dehydrogenase NADP-binding domain-containing protein [Caldilineaceae bacterium]|nr:saccharopine dehydrogenase NADP-binding domain-containing protein [Caldilineaceae bacterium]